MNSIATFLFIYPCNSLEISYDKIMHEPKALPKSISTLFFIIGLISAISFRAIIIVQHANSDYVRLLWYIAVISNLVFFLFRYHISLKRKHAIRDSTLMEKLRTDRPLKHEDRMALIYLLTSINRSRENLNYLSIFLLSGLAILIDIIMTLQG